MTPFVCEGHVQTRALRRHQDLSEPIPPGECAITSLCCAPDGKIFGATSGKRSHLFVYDPSPGQDSVIDLGVLPGAKEVRRALVATRRGIIGGVTVADDSLPGGYLFAYPRQSREGHEFVDILGFPLKGEGIAALTCDPCGDTVFGVTTQTGTFFVYELETGNLLPKQPVDDTGRFSHALVCDRAGNTYGTRSWGELFMYSPALDVLRPLGLFIPSIAGRQMFNQLDAAVLDERSGLIYGGGSADGVLFIFDPSTQRITSLGKAVPAPRVRCLTVGLDGRVFGIGGEREGMGRLFCYDPQTRDLTDLGIPYSGMDRVWHGYEFDAACTGRFGEIYLGESDRVSHLFIYFPPVCCQRESPNGSEPFG